MREAPPLTFGAVAPPLRKAAERAWWRAVARTALERAGLQDRVPFDAFFDLAWSWFRRPEAWRVPADVRPGLRALRAAGVPLAVFSNWDGRLPRLLAALGLDGFFARILVSAALPAAKPEPAAYRAAAAALAAGAPAWRGAPLMAGDRPDHDVESALAAGWDAILIDRAGKRPPIPAAAGRVESLVELADTVAAAVPSRA